MTMQQNSGDRVCQISICLWESQVVRSFDKSPTWNLRCHVMVTCVMVSCLHPPYFSLNSAYWTNSGKREAPLADTFPIPIGWSVSYFNNNSVVPRTFFGFKGCLKMIARSFSLVVVKYKEMSNLTRSEFVPRSSITELARICGWNKTDARFIGEKRTNIHV